MKSILKVVESKIDSFLEIYSNAPHQQLEDMNLILKVLFYQADELLKIFEKFVEHHKKKFAKLSKDILKLPSLIEKISNYSLFLNEKKLLRIC